MTEVEKLLHSLQILKQHRHTTFKLVHGEYNIEIDKLIKEINDN
jgi:hypothetical protein